MRTAPLDAVTGAFSHSGAAITAELKARGRGVRTLTSHPQTPTSDGRGPDEVCPLDFTDPGHLRASLTGIDTLINTYWVRFPRAGTTFADAVANSQALFEAATDAGVRRIVHLSIAHADPASPYPYFAGKGLVEEHLAALPVSHAILRPAILFGGQAVLLNNIAWLLRHLPVFAIGGHGTYRIRGIHLTDLARLCADETDSNDNSLRDAVHSKAILLEVPGALIPACATGAGLLLRDTLLTRDEYAAMADGLADTTGPATGTTAVTDWIAQNGSWLGRRYLNDTKTRLHPTADVT